MASGTVETRTLTPALLGQVFGIEGHFAETPDGPIFQPLRILRR